MITFIRYRELAPTSLDIRRARALPREAASERAKKFPSVCSIEVSPAYGVKPAGRVVVSG